MIRNKRKRKPTDAITERKLFDLVALKNLNKLPRAPTGPSREELLYGAYLWAEIYDRDALRIDVEVELNAKGHRILWNRPNHPQYNASELFNNHVKRNMKEDFEVNRRTDRMCRDLQVGMNGGQRQSMNKRQSPVDPQMCKNWMRHCWDRVKSDGNELGLKGDVIDWWTPGCKVDGKEVDLFHDEIQCPFSTKRMREMESKFTIDTSTWSGSNHNSNSDSSRSS